MYLEFYKNYIPDKLYLDKKLESKSLKKLLDSSALTAYRLYVIANGQKESIQLYDEKLEAGLHLKVYVKLNWAFASFARQQVYNVKAWRSLLRLRPSWELAIYLEKDHKELYKFRHKVTRIDHLHQALREQKPFLEELVHSETKLNNSI